MTQTPYTVRLLPGPYTVLILNESLRALEFTTVLNFTGSVIGLYMTVSKKLEKISGISTSK